MKHVEQETPALFHIKCALDARQRMKKFLATHKIRNRGDYLHHVQRVFAYQEERARMLYAAGYALQEARKKRKEAA